MKRSSHVSVIFLLFLLVSVMSYAQDAPRKLIISSIVGETIDQTEQKNYGLFQTIKNFVSATFYVAQDSTYFVQIEVLGADGQNTFTRVEYPNLTVFLFAERINHYKELLAGKYVMGQNPVSIHSVDGQEIVWNPPLARIKEKTEPMVETPSSFDSSVYTPSFEITLSGGYGFAKGGIPLTSEDYIVSSDGVSNSYTYSNVEDRYMSAGEGMRFEAEFIRYIDDHAGIFLHTGYSSGSASSRENYRSSSYSYGTDRTIKYNNIPLFAGLHFFTTIGNFRPYIGVGGGFIVQSNLSIGLKRTYLATQSNAASTIEQEVILSSGAPAAYACYAGVSIPINQSTAFFIQVKATLVSFYITRSEITKYTVDGIDRLSALTVREKITEYEVNKNFTETGSGNSAEPRIGGAPTPFAGNSIGLTFGISFGR